MQTHQEAIKLRLRQREGSFEFNRILCGNDHEGTRQWQCLTFNTHLPLLHRLQQSRLSAGCGTVDFIGKDDL